MKLLRPTEAAEKLGVSRSEVYRLVALGRIPAIRLSERVLRFDEDELKEAVRRLRVEPEVRP